jgi:4-amino-4-deoxy-L-arabinose transferase-like glycosyltransferase
MPYDHLMGDEAAPPEPAPSLTFNVAAQPLPAAPPADAKAPATPAPPGVIVSDDRPGYVPPRAADEPPEPLLRSPAPVPVAAAAPSPFVPPPPPKPRARSIADLLHRMDQKKKDEAAVADAPSSSSMWSASEAQAPDPTPTVIKQVVPAAPAPQDLWRPVAAEDDDETEAYDTRMMEAASGMAGAADDADTVIAVAAPVRRRQVAGPSLRLVGLLSMLLLALWMARLGAAPLFDVDEGAFAEATRELVAGHDWGSTTLNGVDRFDKPILVYWLQALSLKTFGATEFAVRFPSALCAFLWCMALGQFAWRRFGPQVAIAAAGILATSAGPMLIGRAATADALLNLLLTLSTLDVWRHLENGGAAPRRRAFAWIGLGLLAKGPIAILVPAGAAGLWLATGRDRSRLQRLAGDARAWGLLALIAAPWYAYALWRHGRAFVDGFLLHHNLDRFAGPLEGHRGSLFYYLEVLPVAMMPWTPLLAPIALHLRARWREPLGRFSVLWLAFVVGFFSLSGTKLPHYVLYGFTPLVLLAAQELAAVGRLVRFALCATIAAMVALGAALPWIARAAAADTPDALYRTLLLSAPPAPWWWMGVPIALLVFALTIWVPNVRTYLSEAEGAIAAAALASAWLVFAALPWLGQTLQDPIRVLARTVPVAQLNLQDRQRVVQWRLHQPSIAFYLGQTAVRAEPAGGDWALTRIDRLTPDDLAKLEIVENVRGYVLVRPAPAASEPLARLGAARNAAAAASQAAYAAQVAASAERAASEAAYAASVAAANARLQQQAASGAAPRP